MCVIIIIIRSRGESSAGRDRSTTDRARRTRYIPRRDAVSGRHRAHGGTSTYGDTNIGIAMPRFFRNEVPSRHASRRHTKWHRIHDAYVRELLKNWRSSGGSDTQKASYGKRAATLVLRPGWVRGSPWSTHSEKHGTVQRPYNRKKFLVVKFVMTRDHPVFDLPDTGVAA